MHPRTIALAAVFAACAAQAAAPTEKPVDRATFAGQWPFTVEKGVVGCDRGSAIKFVAGRKTYALNGTAKSFSKHAGFDWREAREIWRDDPGNPGAKVPIGDMIAAGQALCRPWN